MTEQIKTTTTSILKEVSFGEYPTITQLIATLHRFQLQYGENIKIGIMGDRGSNGPYLPNIEFIPESNKYHTEDMIGL